MPAPRQGSRRASPLDRVAELRYAKKESVGERLAWIERFLRMSGTMIRGIYRMSPRQFRKAIEAGVFGERHVELLGGIPFIMSENPPHILASIRVHFALSALAAKPRWVVNKEHRLELGQWLPLADAVVLHGPEATYGTRLAQADDLALLVEIADSSYAKDSGPKMRRYATFRIPVYWIIDLNRRIIEVRTQPYGKGKQAGYARWDIYQEHDTIPVVLDGIEVGRLAVADLLP
jgi:Uma2 family endonuclease